MVRCSAKGVVNFLLKSNDDDIRTVGHDAAYRMPWNTLMKMMTESYCPRSEIKKLKTKLWNLTMKGLPDNIQGSVIASKAKILQESIEFARSLIDKKNVARVYTIRHGKKREYAGTLPLCNKCKFHHNVSWAAKCMNYKRVGHLGQYCRSPAAANNQRALRAIQNTVTCFECGNQGRYKSDCLKLKNKNHGSAIGNYEAHGRAYC
nr:hypothetical protein [Tanacetum cinerariifolium]